jgi:hypothetical protein
VRSENQTAGLHKKFSALSRTASHAVRELPAHHYEAAAGNSVLAQIDGGFLCGSNEQSSPARFLEPSDNRPLDLNQARRLHFRIVMFVRFLFIVLTLISESTAYAMVSCRYLFQYDIKYDALKQQKNAIQSWRPVLAENNIKLYELFERYAAGIPSEPNSLFRGMPLSHDELEEIMEKGMQLERSGAWGHGRSVIYTSTQSNVAMPYAFSRPETGKNLSVLFEIDSAGLSTLPGIPGDTVVMISESIPRSSIRHIWILDPHASPLGFPWIQVF